MFKQIGCLFILALVAFSIYYIKVNYDQVEPVFYDYGQKAIKYKLTIPNFVQIKNESAVNQSVNNTEVSVNSDSSSLQNLLGQVPNGAIKYEIDSLNSNVSYIISRRFGKRSAQPVVADNNNAIGFGWYDESKKSGLFYIEADAKKFISDNPQMDIELLNYLKFTAIALDAELKEIAENNAKLNINVNFNGVIKNMPIEYIVTQEADNYKVKGEFTIKLSDFNINPPYLKDVYAIDDKVKIKFDLLLQRL